MAGENELWQLMRKHMIGHVVRIENYAGTGQPDVNGCLVGVEWWCELKHIPAFPVRSSTVVKVNHFTAEQRIWLRTRCRNGGRAFFFIRAGDTFFLFDGEVAADHIGVDWIRDQWKSGAIMWWINRVNWSEFNAILSSFGKREVMRNG